MQYLINPEFLAGLNKNGPDTPDQDRFYLASNLLNRHHPKLFDREFVDTSMRIGLIWI